MARRAVVSYWRKYVHEVLVNRLGGLSLPRKSVVRLTDRPNMTLDVYRGRKTTIQYNTGEMWLDLKTDRPDMTITVYRGPKASKQHCSNTMRAVKTIKGRTVARVDIAFQLKIQ